MRIVYIALDPLKYPRIEKIAYTLRKCEGVEFKVMIPKFRFVWRGRKAGRMFFALVNYLTVLLQVFFVRADLFWVANCPDILAVPLILRRKRYILEYRSPWSLEVENEFGVGPWVHLTAFFEYFALRCASIITLTTSRLMVNVKRFRKPIFVIPNYPSKSFGNITVSKEKFREHVGCRTDGRVALFLGKLSRVEGADLLPSIIQNVLKRADVVFWIVGGGPLYPSLEKFAKRLPRKVKVFGWRPHQEIPNFIAAADVCIAPRHRSPYSIFYNEEGVSKLSEYMFFGKPIVACGIADSEQYLLVGEDKLADGIVQALNGRVAPPQRRTWEQWSEKKIFEMLDLIHAAKF